MKSGGKTIFGRMEYYMSEEELILQEELNDK